MKITTRLTLILFIAATITNCTVQKRSYQKGYYVSWNKKTSPLLKFAKQLDAKKAVPIIFSSETACVKVSDTHEPLYASVQKSNKIEVKSVAFKTLKFAIDSCGDLITTRNGEEIVGKVIEITPELVKYKSCDNLNGGGLEINLNNITSIKYKDGRIDEFKEGELVKKEVQPELVVETKQKPIAGKRSNFLASLSFICLLTLVLPIVGIFLLPIALILGIIAIIQITKHPEKYKNKTMAWVTTILASSLILILIGGVWFGYLGVWGN